MANCVASCDWALFYYAQRYLCYDPDGCRMRNHFTRKEGIYLFVVLTLHQLIRAVFILSDNILRRLCREGRFGNRTRRFIRSRLDRQVRLFNYNSSDASPEVTPAILCAIFFEGQEQVA
jgi:hypothetical protein